MHLANLSNDDCRILDDSVVNKWKNGGKLSLVVTVSGSERDGHHPCHLTSSHSSHPTHSHVLPRKVRNTKILKNLNFDSTKSEISSFLNGRREIFRSCLRWRIYFHENVSNFQKSSSIIFVFSELGCWRDFPSYICRLTPWQGRYRLRSLYQWL